MRRILFGLAVLLTTSCVVPPPVRIETEHGVVRAASRADAESVAEALTAAPELRVLLEAVREDLPEVWVVDRDIGGSLGVYRGKRIDLESAGDFVPVVVAHELVHWYIEGSPFDGIPYFVEEGLADYLSLELVGIAHGRELENLALGSLTVTRPGLDADRRGWHELPEAESQALARLGFEVVSRVGLPRLRALADRGAPGWDYLEASRLEFE